MAKDKPSVRADWAEYANRLLGKTVVSNEVGQEPKSPRSSDGTIALRAFAGPQKHAEQLEHLRIAHLTDQHVGRVTPMRIQKAAVALTNAQRPDLIALTGDFVCHSQLFLDELVDVIRGFEAPVIAVLGNHDHWSGADEVRGALRQAGAEILDNRHTVITLRGQQLQVVGLDDAYTGHADRAQAVKGLRKDIATIGLSHIAEEADGLWHEGVPIVLSGHTHAGQVTFAGLHELALGKIAGHKYVHGLYGNRGSHANRAPGAVYVGAGIGASVWPFRLGERAQREVALFELGVVPGAMEEHHSEQDALPGRAPSPSLKAKRAEQVLRKQVKREKKKK